MPPKADTRRQRAVAALLVLGIAGAIVWISADRALRGRYDFHHFYHDARHVFDHGELPPEPELPFYPPVVPLLIAPMAAFGPVGAAIAWSAAHGIAFVFTVWTLSRCASLPAGIVALLLAAPAAYEAARFNQLTFVVLALILAGAAALMRGRTALAGASFAAACVLKILPGIFALWLMISGRWKTLAWWLGSLIAILLTPPLIAWGPQRTWDAHVAWWRHNVEGVGGGGLVATDIPAHFLSHQNQSISAVIARMGWRAHPNPAPVQWLDLSLEHARKAGVAATLLLAVGLAVWTRWHSRRSRQADDLQRIWLPVSVYSLAMLVLSPLVRTYYLWWALPALVIFAGRALGARGTAADERISLRETSSTSHDGHWTGAAGLVVWLAGMALWMWEPARSCGVHLWMLLVMAVLAMWPVTSLRSHRR